MCRSRASLTSTGTCAWSVPSTACDHPRRRRTCVGVPGRGVRIRYLHRRTRGGRATPADNPSIAYGGDGCGTPGADYLAKLVRQEGAIALVAATVTQAPVVESQASGPVPTSRVPVEDVQVVAQGRADLGNGDVTHRPAWRGCRRQPPPGWAIPATALPSHGPCHRAGSAGRVRDGDRGQLPGERLVRPTALSLGQPQREQPGAAPRRLGRPLQVATDAYRSHPDARSAASANAFGIHKLGKPSAPKCRSRAPFAGCGRHIGQDYARAGRK